MLGAKGTGQVSKWRHPSNDVDMEFDEDEDFEDSSIGEDQDSGDSDDLPEQEGSRDQEYIVGAGALRGEQEYVSIISGLVLRLALSSSLSFCAACILLFFFISLLPFLYSLVKDSFESFSTYGTQCVGS